MSDLLKIVALGIGIYWITATTVLAMFTLNSCNQTTSKVLDIPEKLLTKMLRKKFY